MDASGDNRVYRLGNNRVLLNASTYWLYQSSYESKDEILYTKKTFDSVLSSKLYFRYSKAIKDCMHNGRTLDGSVTITTNEFKE